MKSNKQWTQDLFIVMHKINIKEKETHSNLYTKKVYIRQQEDRCIVSWVFLRVPPQVPVSFSLRTLGEEKRKRGTSCDQKLPSSVPPGASLHHHLSHHASPDRTLQMHYGI